MSTPAEELDVLETLYNQGLISLRDFEAQKVTITRKIDELMGYAPSSKPQQPKGFWRTYFGVWKKAFNFSTRTNRTEYFLFILFNWAFSIIFAGLFWWLFMKHIQHLSYSLMKAMLGFYGIWGIMCGWTTWVATAQRLRDTNRSGLIVLLNVLAAMVGGYFKYIDLKYIALAFSFIVILINLYLIVVVFFKGTPAPNKYGPKPTPSKAYVSYSILCIFLMLILLAFGFVVAIYQELTTLMALMSILR